MLLYVCKTLKILHSLSIAILASVKKLLEDIWQTIQPIFTKTLAKLWPWLGKGKKIALMAFFGIFFNTFLFFLSGNRPVMVETNFTFGPNPKLDVFVFWFWLSFSQDLRLLGLLSKPSCMKKALQISSKTCFESPRMILHALWKKILPKKSSMVFHYPCWPPPPPPSCIGVGDVHFS